MTQRELVAMAFAGDDVAADFAAQKAEEAEAEAPAADTGPGLLPGWGSWASAKRMQRDAEAAARKAKQ
jgi:U3 small nucleolar RNA-associated protein 14